MKLVACYNVYNEEQFIEQSLNSVYSVFDEIFILDGRVEHFPGRDCHSNDGTIEKIKTLDKDGKVEIISSDHLFSSLLEKSQTLFAAVKPKSWLIHLSPDESFSGTREALLAQLADLSCKYRAIWIKELPENNMKLSFRMFFKETEEEIPRLNSLGEISPRWMSVPTLEDIQLLHYRDLRNEIRKLLKEEYYSERRKNDDRIGKVIFPKVYNREGRLKVAMIQAEPCIRNIKMAIVIRPYTRSLVLISNHRPSEWILSHYDKWYPTSEIENLISNDTFDVIHGHSPDSASYKVIDVLENLQHKSNVRLIHDSHDLTSLQFPTETIHLSVEEKVVERADGIICVSEEMRNYFFQNYKISKKKDRKRFIVVPSMLPYSLIPHSTKVDPISTQPLGIVKFVFEGSLYNPEAAQWYLSTFKEFVNHCRNVDLTVYSKLFENNESPLPALKFGSYLPFEELLTELTNYHFAFIPLPNFFPQRKVALPNKFWESIAAGLPIITNSVSPAMRKFIKKYDIGIVYEQISDLTTNEIISKYSHFKNNVLWLRKQFSLNNYLPEILQLYYGGRKSY